MLVVRDLRVAFRAPVLRGIDVELHQGRTLGIVGESGSGKSLTALALLGLLPAGASVTSGQVLFDGEDLLRVGERRLRAIRGRAIGMVFQDPAGALNPVFTIGRHVRESLTLHLGLRGPAATKRAEELLHLVRIPDPAACMHRYPHELSGGMKQRVMIAMAISCGPKLLIADEPTTALDVTTQAQILALLQDLKARLGMAIMLITHDLGVVAEYADDVAVMYAGRIVEHAPAPALFARRAHPYTEGLLRSMPSLDEDDPPVLSVIPGVAASAGALPPGCAFHPRCSLAIVPCASQIPPLETVGPAHTSACLLACRP